MQTFLSPVSGLIGTIAYGEVEWYRGPVGKNTVNSEFAVDKNTVLPRVDIIMAYENMDGALIDAAAATGAKGVIIAGVGNGNMTKPALEALCGRGEEGRGVRAFLARHDGPGGPERRGGRRQDGHSGIVRAQPAEVARAAAPGAAEDLGPEVDPALLR